MNGERARTRRALAPSLAQRLSRVRDERSSEAQFSVMGMNWRRLWIILFVVAPFGAAPARALVGPSNEDRSFASHVVMVLKRGVDRAGFCTGVVLGPREVLTAAHCLAAAKDLRIFYRDDSGNPVLLDVQATVAHPRYRADAPTARVVSIDLALIQTQTPLDARFSAAALEDDGRVQVGQPVRIVGYGVTREGEGTSAGVLRSAPLQARAPISTILLWAEDPNGAGAGGCTGDSGGPILTGDGEKVLAITTWSAGSGSKRCGSLTQGPLVAPQRGWIDGVLQRWRR
jgi:S1-C subfamily serine protease